MIIVTDRAADLAPDQINSLNVHFASLRITLNDRTYESGIDLDSETFYKMLAETDSYPTTSQPSAGEFAELYRKLAETGEPILSIHISSGLSGTYNAAVAGAQMVPEANVTVWDSKTLSCPLGWQVEIAARVAKAGARMDEILARLDVMREKVEGLFTLDTLKYLIQQLTRLSCILRSGMALRTTAYKRRLSINYSLSYAQVMQILVMFF